MKPHEHSNAPTHQRTNTQSCTHACTHKACCECSRLRICEQDDRRLLDRGERSIGLLLHVVVAYASRKFERMCAPEIDDVQGLDGEADVDGGGGDAPPLAFEVPSEPRQWALMSGFGPGFGSGPGRGVSTGGRNPSSRGSWWRDAVRRYYPWVHAGKESAVLAFQILYLFDRTPYCSPFLWLVGQTLKRVTRPCTPDRSPRSRSCGWQRHACARRARVRGK